MRVSVYPSCDPFTICQIMIVGGCGLWLDELRLSGAQLKPGPALLDAGLLLQALPALIFYKL